MVWQQGHSWMPMLTPTTFLTVLSVQVKEMKTKQISAMFVQLNVLLVSSPIVLFPALELLVYWFSLLHLRCNYYFAISYGCWFCSLFADVGCGHTRYHQAHLAVPRPGQANVHLLLFLHLQVDSWDSCTPIFVHKKGWCYWMLLTNSAL